MPDTRVRPSRKRRKHPLPHGAQGKPLSAYPGWDEVAGEFRMDASLAEIEDYYQRLAQEDTGTPTEASSRKGSVKPGSLGERATS
jgi:hypothetical protein